jgi:putative ABC transport system permease protein
MIKFLLKGLVRDRHRSLFPILIVSFGVLLTTVLYSFINGELNDLIDSNARFDTGHLKIMTRWYNTLASQMPNDLALTGSEKLMLSLRNKYPDYDWTARIKFVGLLDVPDKNGETKAQNPVFGLAVNLFGKNSMEVERLNLGKSLVRGRMPEKPREILISEEFAKRMNTGIGQPITLISTTSSGAMAVQNFIVCGTVKFGVAVMDRGAMITDISDIQFTLEMPDGASEILGFKKNKFYDPAEAEKIKIDFNSAFIHANNQYSPLMVTLEDQNGLGEYLDYINTVGLIIVGIFLVAMSVVLLNTGLMSGIRRYGEVGVRLALGEAKDRIYKSMLYESVLIGFAGSVIGTCFGLAVALYLQEFGIDITETLRSSSIMMSNILRARISVASFYIGFIPGLMATLIGTTFSGIQIFQRQTASLFKELEA